MVILERLAVQLVETAEGLLLRPIRSEKLSLEESFREMASDPDAMAEAESLQGTLADGLEHDELSAGVSRRSRKTARP